MKMYVDLIILLNFFLDFILLFSVAILLKRKINLIRISLASLLGGISIISLFVSFNSLELFVLKIVISIFMVVISFEFKNLKYTINNLGYLYLVSIILGGFLYFINDELSYKNTGLVFYHSGFSINWLIVIFSAPVILVIYIKQNKKIKDDYQCRYNIKITFLNNKKVTITGFLDTGNNLIDPYKKRPIIMINKDVLGNYKPNIILVPCITVNKKSMLQCFKIKSIFIEGKKVEKEILVGISDNNFKIEGVDCLLHKKIIKEGSYEKNN